MESKGSTDDDESEQTACTKGDQNGIVFKIKKTKHSKIM
jgi:hypothetical protein